MQCLRVTIAPTVAMIVMAAAVAAWNYHNDNGVTRRQQRRGIAETVPRVVIAIDLFRTPRPFYKSILCESEKCRTFYRSSTKSWSTLKSHPLRPPKSEMLLPITKFVDGGA
jgi:hypothetical protein